MQDIIQEDPNLTPRVMMDFDSPQLARDFIDGSRETLRKLRDANRLHEAEMLSGERIRIARQLCRSEPSKQNSRRLAGTICLRASLRVRQGAYKKAERTYAEANKIREATLDCNSGDEFSCLLAQGYFQQGRCLAQLNRHREAIDARRKSQAIWETIDTPIATTHLAYCLHDLAFSCQALSQSNLALGYCIMAEKRYSRSNGETECSESRGSLRVLLSAVLKTLPDVSHAKSYLRARLHEAENACPNEQTESTQLWLRQQLLGFLSEIDERSERIFLVTAICESILRQNSSAIDLAFCENQFAIEMLNNDRFADARAHNQAATKLLAKHASDFSSECDLRDWILQTKSDIAESSRKYPEPAARKNRIAKNLDALNLAIFGNSGRTKSEFKKNSRESIRVTLFSTTFWFACVSTDYFGQLPSAWQWVIILIGLLVTGPRFTRPLLNRLADGFESRFLNSLARRMKSRLPPFISRLLLVKINGNLRFRVWAAGFIYPIAVLEQSARFLSGSELAVWNVVCNRPLNLKDRELRRCVSTINLSMPHSALRQLFTLLPRGTHPSCIGTCEPQSRVLG